MGLVKVSKYESRKNLVHGANHLKIYQVVPVCTLYIRLLLTGEECCGVIDASFLCYSVHVKRFLRGDDQWLQTTKRH